MNGEASDELGAGLHVLETCETPFIKRIIQKIQGTKTPFQSELYYVNKVEIPQLRWGVGLGAMGAVGGMVKDSMSGMTDNFSGMMNATQQPTATLPTTAAADKCKNCGAALAPGAKFCLECGTKCE